MHQVLGIYDEAHMPQVPPGIAARLGFEDRGRGVHTFLSSADQAGEDELLECLDFWGNNDCVLYYPWEIGLGRKRRCGICGAGPYRGLRRIDLR